VFFRDERDVSERLALLEQLRHQAFHDSLTGLPNRALFDERLRRALVRLRRSGGFAAVMFVDLDDFKTVNDSLGHDAGDRLLVILADRLRGAMRQGDIVARLGGDEFVVLCDDLRSLDEISARTARIDEALRAPFTLRSDEVFVDLPPGTREAAQQSLEQNGARISL
jgi:diguanylate cyclase (GGDEF)-like protein